MKNLNVIWNQLFITSNNNNSSNKLSTNDSNQSSQRKSSFDLENDNHNFKYDQHKNNRENIVYNYDYNLSNSPSQKISTSTSNLLSFKNNRLINRLLSASTSILETRNFNKNFIKQRRYRKNNNNYNNKNYYYYYYRSNDNFLINTCDDDNSNSNKKSISSCPIYNVKDNDNDDDHCNNFDKNKQHQQNSTLNRRAISCSQIDNYNLLSMSISEKTPPSPPPPNQSIIAVNRKKINQHKQQQPQKSIDQHYKQLSSVSSPSIICSKSYKHYQCRSNVCVNPLSSSNNIDIIREEDEDELSSTTSTISSISTSTPTTSSSSSSNTATTASLSTTNTPSPTLANEENKLDSNDKMFVSSQKEPIRPIRQRQLQQKDLNIRKLPERIEPFQKPDELNSFWQQPKEMVKNDDDNNNDDNSTTTTSSSAAASPSLTSKILLRRNSNHQQQQQQPQNFIRSNHNNNIRSSCPPASRHRRKSMATATTSTTIDSINLDCDQLSSSNGSNNVNNRVGFVDNIQTKFNNVPLKSWLSSFFHSFNSKEKQHESKWKKSNDFQAEFFDRQNDLMTESLLNRRSPLDLNINKNNSQQSQMSPLSQLLTNIGESTKKQQVLLSSNIKNQFFDNNNNNNHNNNINDKFYQPSNNNNQINWIENSIHEPINHQSQQQQQQSIRQSFLRQTSLIKKPRPRSACLDNTYMLRMRNGNFIEYNLDSESKDESCSIISSHHHLKSSPNGTNAQQINVNYKRQSSPLSCQNIKSDIISSPTATTPTTATTTTTSSSSSSSPFLTKPSLRTTVTPTTTTTSSSLSSACISTSLKQQNITNNMNQNQFYRHHQHYYQQHSSYSTKTSDSSSSADPNQFNMECPTYIKIYWPVRNCTEIEINTEHTAFDVIKQILTSQIYQSSLPANQNVLNHYRMDAAIQWSFALRLICRNLNPNDHIWLHPTKNMMEFLNQNQMHFEKNYKLELRMRYIPANLEDLYRNHYPCFKFLYNQILEEFLELELSSTKLLSNQDLILELGCYEICRQHPYLTPQALEKNNNWDILENDFHRIFPICFTDSIKPKQLRKLIRTKFKKIYQQNQEQTAFNFMTQIIHLINYNREVFHCSLGESIWCVPVDLMIGPKIGIAYFTSNSSPPTHIVKSFDLVEQINIKSYSTINKNLDQSNSSGNSDSLKKILLTLRIKNEDDALILTCTSFSTAQSIADLIDGYHRLATNNIETIWSNIIIEKHQQDQETTSSPEKISLRSNSSAVIEPKKAQFNLISRSPHTDSFESYNKNYIDEKQQHESTDYDNDTHEDGDYSNPLEYCLEIPREHLEINELLGTGHFGNVHKGTYNRLNDKGDEENVAVAVKISRVQNKDNSAMPRNEIQMIDQKLLCEAERMHKLDHSNIIKLIGVCSSSPVYVVMELAEYGELRNFLLKNGSQIEHRRLLEYSYQISSAMAFLESKQFVHRDIAARNVLVFSFDCVKLADFGLSRYIEDTSYYMATNSKLPIKWMAPESINFRRFTTASDVWMFGVCIWEIFMLGKKPFPAVKNPDVIGLIECGERLSKPSRCPEQLYELMLKCWRFEPDRRPSFRVIKRKIYDVYQNELGLIGAIARADIINDLSDSKTSLSSAGSGKGHSSSSSSSLCKMHLSNARMATKESNLSSSASQNSVLHPNKIKEILNEQRKQMQEDQKWLQQHDWNQRDTYTKSHSDKECGSTLSTSDHNSTTPSIYEDAHSDRNMIDQKHSPPSSQRLSVHHLYSVPNLQSKSRYGEESCNSYKSTQSSLEHENSNPSTSSLDSNHNNATEDCGLSVSLRKFFKHNQLTNAKVRKEMMEKVNCSSADVDRKDDPVYWGTINVVNSVRYLLKGVQELNTTEFIDLVKNVGQELRNLLANVDLFSETAIAKDERNHLIIAQKKLSTDMNDLVESMKKAIMYTDTPMEGAYKQNMLEASFILVIDSKNLMDTVDEIRLRKKK